MAAIITALLPFFALSIVLIRSYVHEGREVDVASLGGTFHHVDLKNGTTGSTQKIDASALAADPVWKSKVIIAAEHWKSRAHLDARARKATVMGFIWFFWGITLFVSTAATCALVRRLAFLFATSCITFAQARPEVPLSCIAAFLRYFSLHALSLACCEGCQLGVATVFRPRVHE